MRHLLILVLLPGLGLAVHASVAGPRSDAPRSDASTSGATACTASAYVVDRDPNGLNVRRAPNAAARVSARLRTSDAAAVAVRITGAQGAWVRIDRAETQGDDRDRVLFAGTGWVYGPLLGVDGVGAGTPLHRTPADASAIKVRMPAGGDGAILRGCRGDWLDLEYRGVRGWARADAVCANALTSCS